MTKVKGGLMRTQFRDEKDGEPVEIRAHEDGIQMDIFFKGEEKAYTVSLTPHHIDTIKTMYEDWWDTHWAQRHEEEA